MRIRLTKALGSLLDLLCTGLCIVLVVFFEKRSVVLRIGSTLMTIIEMLLFLGNSEKTAVSQLESECIHALLDRRENSKYKYNMLIKHLLLQGVDLTHKKRGLDDSNSILMRYTYTLEGMFFTDTGMNDIYIHCQQLLV